jgi:hypothetical protein
MRGLAKNVFLVRGIDDHVAFNRALRWAQGLALPERLEPCLIGIEACGTSRHWARELIKLGQQMQDSLTCQKTPTAAPTCEDLASFAAYGADCQVSETRRTAADHTRCRADYSVSNCSDDRQRQAVQQLQIVCHLAGTDSAQEINKYAVYWSWA